MKIESTRQRMFINEDWFKYIEFVLLSMSLVHCFILASQTWSRPWSSERRRKMLESGRCASKTCKDCGDCTDCGDWRDWCHKIPQIAFVLPPPPLWWWWSGGGGGSTTTAINIRCVAICAVLLQNRLSRDLRIFGVNFFSWKWRQKWQIWGMEVHCINRVENLNFRWLRWLFTLFCRI